MASKPVPSAVLNCTILLIEIIFVPLNGNPTSAMGMAILYLLTISCFCGVKTKPKVYLSDFAVRIS